MWCDINDSSSIHTRFCEQLARLESPFSFYCHMHGNVQVYTSVWRILKVDIAIISKLLATAYVMCAIFCVRVLHTNNGITSFAKWYYVLLQKGNHFRLFIRKAICSFARFGIVKQMFKYLENAKMLKLHRNKMIETCVNESSVKA